jgi:uncharacterized protein
LRPLRIAVIGSGISGLSAAWLLSQQHDVTVFEADNRLGGHSHTVDVPLASGAKLPVDTGFIVSNTWTYPNFTALMSYLDVDMIDTKMTFSVSCDGGRYEYSGDSLATLVGRARQWVSPKHWHLIADLVRFYRTAEKASLSLPEDMTVGQFLSQGGYSKTFVERHILPIAGAIWSSGSDAIATYPLRAFVRFFANHKLFMLGDRPDWQTVNGGSREYVTRLIADGKFEVRLGQGITGVTRHANGVDVEGGSGFRLHYDHVVMATHADQALRLLRDPGDREQSLLGVFRTSRNRAILHRDTSLMPQCRRFWSGWNYHGPDEKQDLVSVTYWMNALQKLDSPQNHFVSLNPHRAPAAGTVDQEFIYRHPIFTPETLAAQRHLWSLQGVNRTWFAGAWFGAGFHEDGLQAGLAVAEQLGGLQRPWSVAEESGRIHVTPVGKPNLPELVQAAQ